MLEDENTPHYDIAIIGGGIVGASLAYFLSSDGIHLQNLICKLDIPAQHGDYKYRVKPKIAIFEKQTIASEASGLSAGTLWNTGRQTTDSTYAIPTFRYITSSLYDMIQKQENIEYKKCGAVMLAMSWTEYCFAYFAFKKESKGIADANNVQFFKSGHDLRALSVLPQASRNVKGAVYTPQSGQVNGALATHALADMAASKGVDIIEDYTVQSIVLHDISHVKYSLHSSDGRTVTASQVVLANGAWVNSILPSGLRVGVQPVKGQMMVSAPVSPARMQQNIFPVIYFYEAYLAWMLPWNRTTPAHLTHRPDGTRLTRHAYGRYGDDGRYYFGGDRMIPRHARDYEVDEKLCSDLISNKISPALDDVASSFTGVPASEAGAWAGLMPFSDDGQPIIGEIGAQQGFKNLWIASGFSASGMMDAPGAMFYLSLWIRARLNDQHAGCPPILKEFSVRNSCR